MDMSIGLAEAAHGLVGCTFRFHGRDPATGLDCVGVLAAALERVGRSVDAPIAYRLRGGCLDRFDDWASSCGLTEVEDVRPDRPGDILLCEPNSGQFHVMIIGMGLLVHAHAGLGRVVASPLPVPWPIRRRWQIR
ncbi:hypothetical protein C7451_103252 [Blastomonas natatoria]|uniref:NlpC/P60 family protein n=1 Tax=Blastomonas natatoria TaxID=34015 RepID=A0A2V3VAI3_9SPHN|nr:peptidoglycan endopeptidase [Blastomonas natatoria]PXW78144.1 hypothetical protein C7451_103252 [Blastomonas natatoria]